MAHAREQIRKYVATTAIVSATAGSNVFQTPVYPSGPSKLPGLAVSALRDELVEDEDTFGARIRRDLYLTIEARVKPAYGSDAFDDQMDDLCAEVEASMMADPTLGQRVVYTKLIETTIEPIGELDRKAGKATMIWRLQYCVLADDPETLIYMTS